MSERVNFSDLRSTSASFSHHNIVDKYIWIQKMYERCVSMWQQMDWVVTKTLSIHLVNFVIYKNCKNGSNFENGHETIIYL